MCLYHNLRRIISIVLRILPTRLINFGALYLKSVLEHLFYKNYCSWKCVALDLNSRLNVTALTDSSEYKEEEIDFGEF